MKNLFLVLFIASLTFTSCTTSEEIVTEPTEMNTSLLESFKINRNIDGSYALTHEIRNDVAVDYSQSKTQNEVYLYRGDVSDKQSEMNYDVVDNTLIVAFIDENNSNIARISILDDDTKNKSDELGLLNTYSLVYNNDGTVQVDFIVEEGVEVAFGFNSDENINDIYLTEGDATQTNYSKNYSKEDNVDLHIDFVQEIGDKSTEIRKPRVIFSD